MTEDERSEIATLANDLYTAKEQFAEATLELEAANMMRERKPDRLKLFIAVEIARADVLCAQERLTRAQRGIAAAQPGGVGVYVRAALQGQGRWAPDGAAE